MEFVMGSCCLLHSPVNHSLLQIPSSSSSSLTTSSSSQSICFFSPLKTAQKRRKKTIISACMMNQESGNNGRNFLFAKRVILFVGFSVLPVLKMTAKAIESWPQDVSGLKDLEEDKRAEQKHQGDASQNPFISLLSGLGILGSGVLGALYTQALKEKATSDATIEAMRNKLKEKEDAIVSMKKKFESDLINEKEIHNQQVAKLREEQQSLVSQLKSAKDTVVGLGLEQQKVRKLVGELKATINGLQIDLVKAEEDKKEIREKLTEKLESLGVLQEKINFLGWEIKDKDNNIQSLSSAVADKEMKLEKLNSTYQQLQDRLLGLNSENEELKDNLVKNEKELGLKTVAVDDLNAQVGELLAEKEETSRKFDAIQGEYNELKSLSKNKAAEDAKLLEEQKFKLYQLEEQLESTLSEISRNKVQVADLTKERDDLRKMLDEELIRPKSLEQELQVALVNFERSRNDATELASQLQLSRDLCSELEVEVANIRTDFAETKDTLQKKAEEARRGAEVLAGELMSVKELLKKKTEDMQTVSDELATVVQTCNDLQQELVDVYKKAESAVNDLHEEKAIVASLNRELKAYDTKISEEREARKSLERDLEVATRSLNEINRNAVILSGEVELANTHISSLENEKDALYKSLAKQKQISQEARENMEDAGSLIMRLGQERESLEKRAKKLEEELAATKGEILRLRTRINSSKTTVNEQHQETVEVGVKAAAPPVKRTTRRRKAVQQNDDS
ncbi:hypothetical protein ACH5RR_008110 [Cinchona calisaya]|uniref:MAR-binding filament-like protein 1-1 n=1 Tax=Cinchona calisaya TaxID=153742 RepID=A0ABD3ACB0_9GENT